MTSSQAIPAAVTTAYSIGPAFLSHSDTAIYLGIPETTLYQLEYKGVAPRSYKIGRHRKYRLADIEVWIEQRASDVT